jgi:hypothetical protein
MKNTAVVLLLLMTFTQFLCCLAQQSNGTSSANVSPVELSALSPGLAAPLDSSRPIRVSGGIIAGSITHKTLVNIPLKISCLHVSSFVVMRVIIGKDGRVKSVDVLSGADVMRQPTVDAVGQWVYRPFLLHGQPVEVETMVTSTVQLNGGNC